MLKLVLISGDLLLSGPAFDKSGPKLSIVELHAGSCDGSGPSMEGPEASRETAQ